MLTGLIPMLGAGALQSGINQTTDNYGTNPDGSFDPVGYGGGIAGMALGAGAGALAGKALSKSSINKLNKQYISGLGSQSAKMSAAQSAKGKLIKGAVKKKAVAGAESKGLKSLLKGGKGGITKMLAENPKLAMGGGAALGAMLGAKLLGGNITSQTHANQTAQMQNYATQDQYNQQQDAYAIQNAGNINF